MAMAASIGKHGKHFGGVFVGFDFGPDLFDAAIRSDQECDSVNAHVLAAKETFLSPSAVSLSNSLVLVRNQREGKLELADKFVVRRDSISAHAEDDSVFRFHLAVKITKTTRLLCATGSVVARVKIKNDMLASK